MLYKYMFQKIIIKKKSTMVEVHRTIVSFLSFLIEVGEQWTFRVVCITTYHIGDVYH